MSDSRNPSIPIKCYCEYPKEDKTHLPKSLWYVPYIGTPQTFPVKYCPACGMELNPSIGGGHGE